MGTIDGSVTILEPCTECRVSLIRRSQWESMSRAERKASGCRVHAGRGLCGKCYTARLRANRGVDTADPLDFSHISPTPGDALTGGKWCFDPARRVQVYVLDPVVDLTVCPECGGRKGAESSRCRACRSAAARAARTCVGCGVAVVTKSVYADMDDEQRADVRVHLGKGLCRVCYGRQRREKSVAS